MTAFALGIGTDLNFKSLDSLLAKACEDGKANGRAKADLLRKLPMLVKGPPDFDERWNFIQDRNPAPTESGYDFVFNGKWRNEAKPPIRVTFPVKVDNGSPTWCGVSVG